MLNLFAKKLKVANKGFTLVEIMVVIAIIGLLAVVLIPKIGSSKDAAKVAGVEANMKTAMAEINTIIDNYTDPVELEVACQKKLNGLLTNPYNGQTAALRWYDNGKGGGDQANNTNGAFKTHYYPPSGLAGHTIAQSDAWFATTSNYGRPNCAGMVVMCITHINNQLGVSLYAFDGAGNPVTPPSKVQRVSR